MTHEIVALMLEGGPITEVAFYGRLNDDWTVRKLEHPAEDKVTPIVGQRFGAFRAGRYFCAFRSDKGSTLEVVDMGENFQRVKPDDGAQGPIVGNQAIACSAGGLAYGFSASTGKWDVVDCGGTGVIPFISRSSLITFTNDKGLFVFDPAKGKWQTTSLDADADKNGN